METIYDCPFGSKCEEVKDGKIHRCRFYIKMRGKDPQSEDMLELWDCTFSWLPILMLENAQTNRGQTKALESFRNEYLKGQDQFLLVFRAELERRRNLELLEDKVLSVIEKKKLPEVIDVKGD